MSRIALTTDTGRGIISSVMKIGPAITIALLTVISGWAVGVLAAPVDGELPVAVPAVAETAALSAIPDSTIAASPALPSALSETPVSAPAPPAAPVISPDSQFVNIELKDADIRDVLIALGRQAGVNIVAEPSLQGKVTMHLENIRFPVALDALVNPYGYVVERQGELYLIKKKVTLPAIQVEQGPTGALFVHASQSQLRDVLQEIAKATRLSIVARPGVEGVVTIDLTGVSVESALKTLAANFGYELRSENGVYVIAPPEQPAPPVAPVPPAPPVAVVRCDSGLLTVDVQGMEIRTLLDRIARAAAVNIIVANDVTGTIDLYLDKMPLEQALEHLLATQGFFFRRTENAYRVFKNPAGQATAAATYNVVCTDSKVTVDVQEADLGQLLTELATQSGNDLIIFGAVRDKVNVRLTAVPLDEAIDLILAGTRWSAQRQDNIIMIGDRAPGSSTAGLLTRTKVITLRHLKVAEIANLLPQNFSSATVKILTEQNALVARGTRLELQELEDYITRIDKAPPVIMIDVLVVEYSDRTGYDQTLSVSATSADGSNEVTLSPGNIAAKINVATLDQLDQRFTATLQLLVSEGRAKVRANPRISALSGHEASINVGTEEYFKGTTGNVETPLTQLEKISSGIMMTITPWSSEGADRITVKVKAEVSSPGQVNSEGLPAISTRNATTELAVRDGQTIVIGGLIESRVSNTEERVPVLGRIPIIGALFSTHRESERQSELVFYITPHLALDGIPAPAGVLSDTVVVVH